MSLKQDGLGEKPSKEKGSGKSSYRPSKGFTFHEFDKKNITKPFGHRDRGEVRKVGKLYYGRGEAHINREDAVEAAEYWRSKGYDVRIKRDTPRMGGHWRLWYNRYGRPVGRSRIKPKDTTKVKDKVTSKKEQIDRQVQASFSPLREDYEFPRPVVSVDEHKNVTIFTSTSGLDSSGYEHYNEIEEKLKQNLPKRKGINRVRFQEKALSESAARREWDQRYMDEPLVEDKETRARGEWADRYDDD